MTTIGINIDPGHGFTIDDVVKTGAKAVRVVLKSGFSSASFQFLSDCTGAGITTMGVIAAESMYVDNRMLTNQEAAIWYHDRYEDFLDLLQIGNEPDIDSPSSWTMLPVDLNQMIWTFSRIWDKTPLVGPGLASGNPGWVNSLAIEPLSYLAIHPYGQRPTPPADEWADLPGNFGYVASLYEAYRSLGLPVLISEYGANEEETGPDLYNRYVPAMTDKLVELEVPYAFHFCLDDVMVPSFGLYHDGNPKPCLTAFREAALSAIPFHPGGKDMKIEEFAKVHKDRLTFPLGPDGKPLWGDAHDLGHGIRIAGFDEHVVIEINGECWVADNDSSFFG